MFKLIILLCIVATTSGFVGSSSYVGKIPLAYPSTRKMNDDGYALLSSINGGDDIDISRRTVLLGAIVLPACFWTSQAHAAKLRPDDAYANLSESLRSVCVNLVILTQYLIPLPSVKAREELKVAGEYISKKDTDGLRSYVTNDATNMNNYEINAQALLESKRLDAESKKDVSYRQHIFSLFLHTTCDHCYI